MMRTGKGKALIVAALAVLILTAAVGGTVAWLATEDGPIRNVFTPSTVTCAVSETFEGNAVKTNVSIQNTGDTPAYIRAVIVANWCDKLGKVVEPFAVNREHFIGLYEANWVECDGYYYYTLPVQPGGNTGYLFTRCEQPGQKPAGADHLEVNIICQAVQSTPAKAVGEAWGVVISEGSVTPYSAG